MNQINKDSYSKIGDKRKLYSESLVPYDSDNSKSRKSDTIIKDEQHFNSSESIKFNSQKPCEVKKQQTVEDIVSASKGKMKMKLGDSLKKSPIKITLQAPKIEEKKAAPVKPAVSSVFNPDSDSDEEEMPAEAKMRMKNVGRFTPTASGPNSFGKGSLGFSDRRKLIEKEIIELQEKVSNDKKQS